MRAYFHFKKFVLTMALLPLLAFVNLVAAGISSDKPTSTQNDDLSYRGGGGGRYEGGGEHHYENNQHFQNNQEHYQGGGGRNEDENVNRNAEFRANYGGDVRHDENLRQDRNAEALWNGYGEGMYNNSGGGSSDIIVLPANGDYQN